MRFRLLGPLEVRSGEDWSGISAGKQRALLAALLLKPGQAVSTDRLIAEIWGEEPPAKATNLVSIYVLKLRRIIGDPEGKVLVTRSPGYQLRLASGDLDAARFAELAAAGRRGAGQRGARACVGSAHRGARRCGAASHLPTCRPRPWSRPRLIGWRSPASRRKGCGSKPSSRAAGRPAWWRACAA